MAPICDRFVGAMADYLSIDLEMPVDVRVDVDWRERERLFDTGLVDLCWICGLPYVQKADRRPGSVRLLAAPVMAGARYAGQPVYYSDVIVRADQQAESIEELIGRRWAYNETGSYSGYTIFLAELARLGIRSPVLARSVEAGSHENALRMIVADEADFAAIDSTVLDLELKRWPELADLIRVVTILGPGPIPPILTAPHVPDALHNRIKAALLKMHKHEIGRVALSLGRVSHFAAVDDRQYDAIREADRLSAPIHL